MGFNLILYFYNAIAKTSLNIKNNNNVTKYARQGQEIPNSHIRINKIKKNKI